MDKFKGILKSRKFYVLLGSILTLVQALVNEKITDWQFLQGLIGVASAFMVGTGIESGLERQN